MANDVPYKLYHWSRADRSVTAIADDVGPLFMTSPDGKRILFEKITSQTTAVPRKRELAIINANGSDAHVLRDLSVFGNHYDLPMFPMWRNNEEIAFIPALNPNKLPASGAEGRLHFDVVLYRLTSEFTLEPVRILSEGWTESTKPGMDKKDLNVATTTQPVTSTQSNPQPPAANGP
jgi:hypothetical protein